MSANTVEKNAQALNHLLRTQGKKKGKQWRQRIRTLLAQTFEALNAKPLDGALCLRLSEEIEKELAQTDSTEQSDSSTESARCHPEISDIQTSLTKEAALQKHEPNADVGSEEPPAAEPPAADKSAKSMPASDASCSSHNSSKNSQNSEETGLFDLIHIQIRCLIWIRACVRPPYIGQFVRFADRFAEVKTDRIERFLSVLSKGEDDFSTKMEVDIGYREDLLPDMPERGLVLHPKRKKK